MSVKDLLKLEIGLELLKLEEPMGGQCDALFDMTLEVIRQERMRAESEPEEQADPIQAHA